MMRLGVFSVWLAGFLAALPASASTKASTMHYLKAILLQRQGNYVDALKEYDIASQLDPRSPYILQQAANLALEVGQTDKALGFARRDVEIEPNGAKPRILLGQVHWARGEAMEAQKSFEAALKFEPKSSEAMFALGHLLSAQSPEKAKKYFQRYLENNPDNAPEAHFQIALVDQHAGHIDEAISHLKAAIALQPDNPQGHFTLAQLYEVKKDTDAALGEYQKLATLEPEDLSLIEHIGELYFFKGDLDGAQEQFLKAKSLSPHNPGACLWLAILSEHRADYAAAAHYLEDSSALGEDPDLSLRLSYYLTQANRLQDSVRVLEEAHKKKQDAAEISYFLALGYSDLKRYDDAVSLLQEVLKKNPDSRDVRFELGTIYEKLNRVPDMEREFKVLLDKSPTDAGALNYLGYSLVDRGIDLPNAESLIRRAVDLDPGNGAYHDSLGWVYFKEKEYPKALEELRRASQLLPDDATVLDHLGDAYAQLQKPVEAWEAWKSSTVTDPENKQILKKLGDAEKSWSSKELGERLAEFLAKRRGRIAGFAGLCQISATVGERTVSLTSLFSYKKPDDLNLDILGPLFVPMFHIRLDGEKPFAMDQISADGISPDVLHRILERSFMLLRDYLSGAVFLERPVDYHNGWRTRWISTPKHQMYMDDTKGRVQGIKSEGESAVRLSLDDFKAVDGHSVPSFFRIEGKGFSVSFQLKDPKVSFQEPASQVQP